MQRVLTNKTILIISPQCWNHVFVSKHHYALTLAEMGNKVYFLNPIDIANPNSKEKITIEQLPENENLFCVNHTLYFPYKLKFHSISIFHWLMYFHIKKILKQINKPLDIVWSFDLGNYFPLKMLPAKYKIFHPVDEPLNVTAYKSARGADIIFSVTKEILHRYSSYNINRYVIDHGLSTTFVSTTNIKNEIINNKQIRVGLSGNHTRTDIDWPILITIIEQSPEIIFEFWGPNSLKKTKGNELNNIQQDLFIDIIKKLPNVILHGVIGTKDLASELNRMDAFLICYDILKDQSKGTNYHKILEYISTGKVIISNNITAYHNKTDLVQMSNERNNNNSLPSLFKNVINNLEIYNTPNLQNKRKLFAAENTYLKQIERIEAYIYS